MQDIHSTHHMHLEGTHVNSLEEKAGPRLQILTPVKVKSCKRLVQNRFNMVSLMSTGFNLPICQFLPVLGIHIR